MGLCAVVHADNQLTDEAKEALPNIVMNDFSYPVPAFVKKEYVEKLGTPRADDIFVASWPKSGTNWVKQIVHIISIRGDPEQVKLEEKTDLSDIVPFLEADGQVDHSSMLSPRIFQTHLSYADLPKGGRAIYVLRDLPDIATSFYKYVQQFEGMLQNNTVDEVAFLMMGCMLYYGCWPDHIASYWNVRDQPNVLLVKFEELKIDLDGEITRIANFLGINLTPEEHRQVAELSSFKWMKKNAYRISGKEWSVRITGLPVDPEFTLVNKGESGAGKFTPEKTAEMQKYWTDRLQTVVGTATYSDLRISGPALEKTEL